MSSSILAFFVFNYHTVRVDVWAGRGVPSDWRSQCFNVPLHAVISICIRVMMARWVEQNCV